MKRYDYEWSDVRACYFVYDRQRGTAFNYGPWRRADPSWTNALCSCSKRGDAEAIVAALNAAVAE